jgi:Mg-chelatase subunit ChlD
MNILDARSCRTLLVPDEPALRGGRVAVRRGQLAGETAVFHVNGRRGAMAAGVRVAPYDEVPPDVLVVPESLATRLGLHKDTGWQLVTAPAVPLTSLTLEAMVEEPADDLWRAVRGGGDLAGQCLWTGVDIGSNVLEIGSRQFRVRAIDETGRKELREIVSSTEIELFLPAARVGLDVVILADCSGSMEVDDLPVSAERVGWSGTSYQMRLDALKEALLRMLQARLRTAGRESRIALLRFATETEQRFPPGEGMVPLDASSPRELITGFEQAVRYLNVSGGTDIAGALLRAAELLDRHGKPGNDRLIVLVSDGRPWVAKTADATGEVVFAVDDPVSLMSHLHRRRNIRVHAIGISNNDLYDAWLRRNRYPDRQGLRPDHPLLERLVGVGGGDPTRIGGIDVLEGYFGGLGAGLTRHVGNPAEAAARPLAASTLSLLRQSAADDTAERGRAAVQRLRDGMPELNDYARLLAGRQLDNWMPFEKTDEIDLILSREELLIPVRSQWEFEAVLMRLHKVMVERGPGRRKGEKATRPAVLHDIYECFREYVVDRLNPIRVVYAHDKTSGSPDDQKIVEVCRNAFQHYLRVIRIESDDAASWSKLRLCLLEEAAACTDHALAAARNQAAKMGAANVPPPTAEAKPDQPSDLSLVFDLRVRN